MLHFITSANDTESYTNQIPCLLYC